jgi:hypothetical protein
MALGVSPAKSVKTESRDCLGTITALKRTDGLEVFATTSDENLRISNTRQRIATSSDYVFASDTISECATTTQTTGIANKAIGRVCWKRALGERSSIVFESQGFGDCGARARITKNGATLSRGAKRTARSVD